MCLASPNLAPITTVERKQDVGNDHFPIKVIINLFYSCSATCKDPEEMGAPKGEMKCISKRSISFK